LQVLEGELTEDAVGAYDAVVFTGDVDRATLTRWNEFCRSRSTEGTDPRGRPIFKPKPIAFFYCFTGGASGEQAVS